MKPQRTLKKGAFPICKKDNFIHHPYESKLYLTPKGWHIQAQGSALGNSVDPLSPERAR